MEPNTLESKIPHQEPIITQSGIVDTPNSLLGLSKLLFFFVPLYFFVYILMQMLRGDNPWVFLDFANLAIHEAGHFFFMPLGFFMHMLGGSIAQILVPLLFTSYFFVRKDWYAAAFCLFWTGESLVDLSVYIGDARAQVLPLIGMSDASLHDWNWILSQIGLLEYDKTFSFIGYIFAIVLMFGGLLGMLIDALVSFQKPKPLL